MKRDIRLNVIAQYKLPLPSILESTTRWLCHVAHGWLNLWKYILPRLGPGLIPAYKRRVVKDHVCERDGPVALDYESRNIAHLLTISRLKKQSQILETRTKTRSFVLSSAVRFQSPAPSNFVPASTS